MTRVEFAGMIAYLETSLGKPIDPSGPKQGLARMQVYFELLGDLPLEVMMAAARRVILEHPWNTFPSIAELRAAASATIRGQVTDLSPAEAWENAWSAAGRIDLEVEGSAERACECLPKLVVEAMRAFGIAALCYGKEPVGVVRGQFLKIYEQLQAREQRLALLPESLKKEIAHIGQQALPAPSLKLLTDIGSPICPETGMECEQSEPPF